MGAWEEYERRKKELLGNKTNNTESYTVSNNGSAWDSYEQKKKELGLGYNVNEEFINTFISDANNFIGSAEEEYGSIGWGNASSAYDARSNSWKDLSSRSKAIRRWLDRNKDNLDEKTYTDFISDLDSISEASSSILDSFNGAKEYYAQWETEDDYNSWYEHMKNLEADDFEEYSQLGKDASNPTWEDAQTPFQIGNWKPFGEGDAINNMVTFAESNKHKAYQESAQALRGGGGTSELNQLVTLIDSQMSEDEKAVYNYYIGKGETEKAAEYLEYLKDTLVKRQGGQIAKQVDDDVFLEAIMGFGAGVQTSIQGLEGLADFFTGNESGTNYTAIQYADQIAASNNTGFLKGFHDVSSAIGGMTPSILVGSLTGGLGGALTMGASATGNAYNEMIDNGYNQWQAIGYGLLVGASEAVLSYALGGISKLGGKVSNHAISNLVSKVDNAIARTAIQLGGNMASEGLEEAIQTVLEPAFKAMMTGEDFEAPEWEEVWYSALLGALTAGVLEGVPTIAGTAISSHQANKVYGADASALVGESLEIDPDNAHAQRMQARLDNNKNVSGYQLNRLVKANEETLLKQDTAKMKSAVESRLTELGETGDISKLADIIVKAQSGEKLTRSERSVLVNSKYGRRVSTELNPMSIESGEYSSAWAENIGTERINTDAYNKGLYDLAVEKTSATGDEESTTVAEESSSVTENPTAKENATEAKFEASTDGKTRIGDLEVSIKEIASVKNGEVILRLEDDSTVSAGDVEYGSSAEALLYENVADMNLNAATANAFVRGYDPSTGMSVEQYALGFREAYRYGEYNFPVNEMSSKGFSDMLSESQRNLAYNLGKTDAKYKIDAKSTKIAEKIASTSAKNVGKDSQKASKKGKLHNTIAPSTERQKASLKALGVLAKTLGIDIYTFESQVDAEGNRYYVMPNGKKTGANGWYDPSDNSIHIDLNAGFNGEGTMLFTAAHELTHFIREWSPAKFKVFADFILENYGKKGISVDALVNAQIEKARKKGRVIDYDTAYEEVIADSCEAMLADGDAISKIAELKAKDKTLWQKIRDYLTNLVARIKDAYKGMKPDSYEGRKVAEMLDTAEKLKALWTEALVDASDSYKASDIKSAVSEVIEADAKPISDAEIITDGAVVTDGNGNKYSIRSMKHDISDGKMFRDLMTYCGFTKEQVGTLRGQLEDLVEYMNPFRDIVDLNETYDMEGRRYAPYKPNSDPLYTISLDFSTQCSKRLLTQYVIEQLQLRENRPMSPEEQMAIRDMLKEYGKVEKGLQVACVMCYVEAARLKAPKQIQKWLDDPSTAMRNFFADKNPEFSAYIKEKQADFKESRGYDRNATKKDMSPKDRTALNKIRPKLRAEYTPSAEEMAIIETASNLPNSTYLTAGNLADLSESHPEIYKAYTAFIRTATRSKALETDEPYYYGDSTRDNGNGIIVSDSFIEAVNRENGMRFSSWSDWRIQHLLDWITAVIDNSVRGAAMHGYTKYGDEVRVLGKTGMMFNMSGVAGTQTGLNEDGSLNFSETESMDYDEAIALREEFPETAGLQCIGVGIDHIYALLRSDVIDYVIPYHTSGLNATLRRMGNIYGWKDFTQTQHATEDKRIKKENAVDPDNWHKEPVFSEFFVGYDTGLTGIEAMRKSAENYKRMCKERGLIPKFNEFANEQNYWKLLIDRKMVNQKTNTLIRQKAVTPTFDFGVIKGIVDKYVANYDSGLEQRAFNHIVENWDNIPKRIRDLKKQGSTKAKKTKKAVDTIANETLAVQPKDESKFSERVTDKDTLDFLNNQLKNGEVTEVYRAMAVDEDGNLYPPMAGYVRKNGKKVINGHPSVVGEWEQSTESIPWDSVDEEFLLANGFKQFAKPTKDYPNGRFEKDNTIFYIDRKGKWKAKFHLDKDNGDVVDAAYAPYIHTSLSVLNDQFTSAYKRDNLVVVKGYVPNSEVNGVNGKRYQANFAEKPVGKTKWHSGVVAAQMPETRTVILSRYFMPIEIVDDSVVAQKTKEMMKGNDIEIPFNVVTPSQRRAMEAIGIRIGEARGLRDGAPKKDEVKYSDRILMGSLFSGGGTLEAGLAYQMLDKEFGVEYDAKIASVYEDNYGDHIQVGRVEDFDISKHDDIFYLHASPVCHNFSKAKHGAKELQMDIDSAKATAQHLETAMPQVFTVENAPGYRKSQSLKIITDKLTELGYKWDVDVYNSADYGSATSRNRVILRAVKDGDLPEKPTKQERTNSWDQVTRDLWDTLPKSYLRPSFISAIENTPKLPILDANGNVNVNKPLLILTTTSGHMVTYCWEGEICPTLTTKCGEAKLVMPDGNIYAVTPEFMGRIQGLPDDYKYPKAKTRAFTIIGNGIPTHLTKAVVGGVLDSAYEQTHNGQVLYSDRSNIGYHAGDLGKAEYYYQQGYGRGTGHFGTGTYFVGNEEKISGDNTYGKRPHHAVDFSDYNLYKIKDEEDGYKLHEQLRVIDGGLRQDFYEKALDDEFSFYPHVNVFELAEKKYKTKSNTWEEAYIPVWKDIANERGIEYQSEEEWSRENNFHTDDEYFADYYSEYLEKVVKEATEAVEEKYRRFRETYFRLWLRFGSANTRRAMQKTIFYQKEINPNGERDYFAERDKKADSLATVFMKNLGYDGIDVRGTRLDNVEYGSVIYDLKEDTVLWQDRDTDSFSNRSLLANALESVAQNDIERKKLEEYKGKIALIEAEQAKLAEVKKKANDIRFTKGRTADETKRMKDLEFEANQIANRINTYDKQLLDLESTKALKGVLEREKQMAYKRAKQRGKEALEAYRERANKTQRELMTRYQESRKKGIDSRNMTAMRHKIKDVVKELNDYLLKGTKDKHVPIQLQKAVAEALDAVNMDTVGAEERIAKKRAEMMRAKSPEVIEKLAKEIEHIQEMGGNMEAKLSRLKTSYDSIINSDDPLIANSHDDVISNTIDKVIEVVGDTALRDMSLYQLEAVYDMYRMILHSIRSANKAFKAAKGEEISTIANGVIAELVAMKRKSPYRTKAMQTISEFDWNNLKPVYAFERIGSANFTKVFNAVRAGEDVWARDMSEASAFREEQSKKYKYDSFDFEKKYAFETNRGDPFELTLGEMMSIYAYAKDEHSKGHLIGEGFVFDPKKEVVENIKGKINVKVNLEDATAYNLSEAVVEKITQTLSKIPGAKDFVDVMQDYLSTTMGEKGNEVSLELYQVKLFKNKNYFPLKSAPQYMAVAKEQAKGDVKIKNKGFTKDRKEGAKNPIVLSSFMDVWANHVNEMSMYHAFTLPLEDFYRVFNYRTPNMEGYAPMSVNASLEGAYGTAATSYIEQLLKDLNGGARIDPTAGVINKLTGLFKKSAVFGSLSVVIQQPSAIARATALVDSKYFVGKSSGKHKEVWAEVKKYAPVAVIKEMGYFDTGMGQSSVEWLKGEKTWKDKVDDALSKAPALADEYTWCAIWNAVKRETLNTYKHLVPNSDAFLKVVGERFTEVITKTQVYDSVLSRSANMRSKDTGMKMATAFMGEPTTSINMLQDALTQGKRGNKRYARKAVGGVVASMILNSILVSLVYAGRDDDEEKTYAEKYVGTLTEELIDSVNPLTLIPFVKDVVSIVQGYDVERSDMAVITDVINAWNNLDSDNRSAYRKVEDFAGALASIFGLPVKNIMRDARGMYNTVNSFINGEKTTGAGISSAVKEAVTGKEESNGQQLYEAMLSGDTAQIERVKGRFKDQNAINSAIRKALRENDPRIKQAAEARYNGDIAGYMRIAKEIIAEGHFKQDDIVSAINSEITALKKGEGTTTASTSSNKVESIYEVADYYSAIEGRDQATAYAVKEDIIKVAIANGKDRDEAEADFNSKFASHLRDVYEVGGITDYEARNMLINYGGKSEEQAYSKVQYWAFKKKYPDYDLTEDAVTKYYNDVEHSGISIDVYYDYTLRKSKCKGVDANGDGKTDSGSVKSEVMDVINSLPISNYQKDVLYYLNGWSASTIWQAPWH